MISASEFRNGATTIEYEGDIFVVLEFQHVKPGKGAAFDLICSIFTTTVTFITL